MQNRYLFREFIGWKDEILKMWREVDPILTGQGVQGNRPPAKTRKGFRLGGAWEVKDRDADMSKDVHKMSRPGNTASRDLMGGSRFSEAVTSLLDNTQAGEGQEEIIQRP